MKGPVDHDTRPIQQPIKLDSMSPIAKSFINHDSLLIVRGKTRAMICKPIVAQWKNSSFLKPYDFTVGSILTNCIDY